MEQTIIALLQTLLENPVTGPAIFSGLRTIEGWLNNKWMNATGESFDKRKLGATLVKYEVFINALAQILPAGYPYVGAIVLVVDILGSFAKKLLGEEEDEEDWEEDEDEF